MRGQSPRAVTPFRRELRRIAVLAAPVVLTQLGSMLLGVVDTLMLGHYDRAALNASSLGRVWVMGTALVAMGVLYGLDPTFSQAHGARDKRALGLALQRGLLLSLALSAPLALLWAFTEPVLHAFGQDAAVCASAQDYALVQIPGLPFLLGFLALRGWLQGRGIVRPALVVVLAGNLLNAVVNYALIFGRLGAPELGVVGAGIATASVQAAMFLALLWLVKRWRLARGAWVRWDRAALSWSGVAEVLRIGLPVSAHFAVEVWAFQIATLWSGELGEVALASHTIVMNISSVSFMVPLGISIGTSTRVGNLIGARRPDDAQRAAWVGLGMGGATMVAAALAFLALRRELPGMYTSDAAVVAGCAAALPIAAAFQLFDGLQVVAAGVLRGMGRTRPAAAIHLLAFYTLGLPLAWWLAFERDHGLRGLWWGLCLGLSVAAAALVTWVARRGPAFEARRRALAAAS